MLIISAFLINTSVLSSEMPYGGISLPVFSVTDCLFEVVMVVPYSNGIGLTVIVWFAKGIHECINEIVLMAAVLLIWNKK
jgi:hypothetical protein